MLVRAAAATLILALVTLVASALLWPTAAGRDALAAADPDALVRAFEAASTPIVTVDVGALYAGHEDLVDPREILPTWHQHARGEAAIVFEATRACPPRALQAPLSDAALAKAYAWFERTCKGGPPPDDLLAKPPSMHPSGRSYAAMSIARRGDDARAFATRNWTKLHVLEIAQSGADTEEARALAGLGSREWLGLLRGDRLVQTSDRIVTAERGPLGLARLRFHRRDAWAGPLVLIPRSTAPCARPASSLLCWEATAPRRFAALQRSITGLAAAIATASVIVLGLAFVRERRRAALDRMHLLRTLTHELRTPAMALGLDIEPLRVAYDDLPPHLQEPLLRISSNIARLHRVLHHGARTLELFEGEGKLASPIEIEATHEMLKDLAAEWPDEVTLTCEGDDGAIVTDPEWLAVALRNLVENACRHGKPPVLVRARLERDALVVRVEDAGSTSDLSLSRATAAWTRAKGSGGLGLGLALVARIAKALGGTLSHEPQPTAFVLRLPRHPDREEST
ncbi:MAG: sensor histidine kinase [Polyangiales bacterium]